ncbi:hypothetical protein AIGOOFII_3235 [Methylobacterium marchantiae]|nr:hypothetical protein AIGOOFII_3235 [Methylobacterium marchantiae]
MTRSLLYQRRAVWRHFVKRSASAHPARTSHFADRERGGSRPTRHLMRTGDNPTTARGDPLSCRVDIIYGFRRSRHRDRRLRTVGRVGRCPGTHTISTTSVFFPVEESCVKAEGHFSIAGMQFVPTDISGRPGRRCRQWRAVAAEQNEHGALRVRRLNGLCQRYVPSKRRFISATIVCGYLPRERQEAWHGDLKSCSGPWG